MIWLLAALALAEPPPEAPTLDVTHWVVRGPVDLAAPDSVVVIEVWATWCGPCRETFPQLSKLQRSYGDQIAVVGLTDENPVRVRRFYDRNRAEMRYALAVDTSGESLQALMFGGFGGNGLPSTYVIQDGKLVWGGAPRQLSAALETLIGPPSVATEAVVEAPSDH